MSRDPELPASVAICSVGELFGGVERHILGLIDGLQGLGVETLLVLLNDNELATQARNKGITPVILPGSNLRLPATSRALADILRQRGIEIVHVHGYKASVLCAVARLWHRFATVRTEHGQPEAIAGSRLRTLLNHVYHYLDTTATRATGATVCYVTKDLAADRMKAHAGLHTAVIPNGMENLDEGSFVRPPEYSATAFNLAIVGRLDAVKGHATAIDALATAGPEVQLHIIGSGPTETQLRQQVQETGTGTRVHFHGFRRDIYAYLAHCDALLMPSLHEGLPYTLLEAMALGRPIIASRTGGLAEVIEDGESGLLTPVGDADALAGAITRLAQDADLCQRLGRHARQVQQSRFSLDGMARRYCEQYRAALTRSGPA